jgi:hypothetical protein
MLKYMIKLEKGAGVYVDLAIEYLLRCSAAPLSDARPAMVFLLLHCLRALPKRTNTG